mmetsp:Transcript_24803/g.56300  ORF Transcript_24803/g.56300 Transcript_24803/m.56300 type:complete len:633 (-) Transcript_24803:141-2039(-)
MRAVRPWRVPRAAPRVCHTLLRYSVPRTEWPSQPAGRWRGFATQQESQARRVASLQLPEHVKQSLIGLKVNKLTDIQARAFEPILRGRSFVGTSKTGTGKTIAYLLPLIERLRVDKINRENSVLILVPTRELCKQIGSAVLNVSPTTTVALLYGGATMKTQIELLRNGSQFIVATPGRACKLVRDGHLQLNKLRTVVIDEADMMLAEAFTKEVDFLLKQAPGHVQFVLFSASLTPSLREVIKTHFSSAELVDLVSNMKRSTVDQVQHLICRVPTDVNARVRAVVHLLTTKREAGKALVFVGDAAEGKMVASHPHIDRRSRVLSPDMEQGQRDAAMNMFLSGMIKILVATPIAARGLDVDGLELVIMFRPPKDPSEYIHQAGRTGRAGRAGTVVMLHDKKEHERVLKIQAETKVKFHQEVLPDNQTLHEISVGRLFQELSEVREEAQSLVPMARELLEKHGTKVLATALAMLDSRYSTLASKPEDCRSTLSAREGFICVLLSDPARSVLKAPTDVESLLVTAMPALRKVSKAIGRTGYTPGGYLVDLPFTWAHELVHGEGRAVCLKHGIEPSIPTRLPKVMPDPTLSRVRLARIRGVPWRRAKLRRVAREAAQARSEAAAAAQAKASAKSASA